MAEHIPIIDLNLLAPASVEAYGEIGRQIHRAAAEVGFFYITGHGIGDEIIARAVNASRAFFSHDLAMKRLVAVDTVNRGYMGMGECVLPDATHHCLKEVFFWGREARAGKLALVGPNQWPDFMPELRAAVLPYYESVLACARHLLCSLALGLGLRPDFFEPYYRTPLARGQLLHYPPPQADSPENAFGAAAHSDFGCITLLWQDDNGGLEVRLPDGDWVSAPPIAGTLVVNIGDLLSRWTAGRLRSTIHRVRNLSRNERYSMAVFFDPDSDALIDAADMGFTGGPQPITAGDYIQSRNRLSFAHYAGGGIKRP